MWQNMTGMEAPTFPLYRAGLVQPENSGLDGLEVRSLWLYVLLFLRMMLMLCEYKQVNFIHIKPSFSL